jgi:hypothetical protein
MTRELRNKFLMARVYRDRAEQLRTIANGSLAEPDRDLLITVALDLERQAKVSEARARQAEAREP